MVLEFGFGYSLLTSLISFTDTDDLCAVLAVVVFW